MAMGFDATFSSAWIASILAIIVGLGSAWMVRRCFGTASQTLWQALFLLGLAAASLATVISFRLGAGLWWMHAIALMGMILTAVTDVDLHERSGAAERNAG